MEAISQTQPIKMSEKSENSQTRLLDAAEVLFAEKGFERTTVRDITTAAHCNVASINYHFKNKPATVFNISTIIILTDITYR